MAQDPRGAGLQRLVLDNVRCFAHAEAGAAGVAEVAGVASPADIEAWNRALVDVTRRMDNPGVLALWEDDGVSLLPSTKPIVGKKAIAAFLDQVTGEMPGAKVVTFEMACSGIEVAGDWASEWCEEHQVVSFPGGKPPFVGWGKMLFVLHRGTDAKWRLRREMWNQGLAPPGAAPAP